MKFLFVIQGEGRGHLTQAIALRNILTQNGHEVVSVLAGKSKQRELPAFFFENIQTPVYRFYGPNFVPFAKNKRTNIWVSFIYNIPKFPLYIRSIPFIRKQIKQSGADVVINFYEIIVGVAYAFFPPRVPCVSLAHQYLFLHPEYRFPNESKIELLMVKLFTHVTCMGSRRIFALSIEKKETVPSKRMIIVPPLLRDEVLQCTPTTGDYLHGYLLNASYAEEIIAYRQAHPELRMHFFWDKKDAPEETIVDDGLSFHKLNGELFLQYMAGCKGYATTAGFESVCEAMYLGKPVLMVPTHIEQSCNAYEATLAGAGVTSDGFDLDALIDYIPTYKENEIFRSWVQQSEGIWLKELNAVFVGV